MKRFFLILSLLLLLFTVTVSSHPGRTDSNGGHWDRKEGTYHYHSGEYAGKNSSSSSSETADDIEENIVQTAPSEETKEEPSEKVIVMEKKTSSKEENPEKEKTLLIIILSVVGAIILGAIIFIAKKSDIENAGCLFYLLIIIITVIFNLTSCSNSQSEEPETYKSHIESCDGYCKHVEEAIEWRIDNEELADRDDIYSIEGVYSEDDVNDSYWEGVYYGYIQGYGDCYYGNAQEQELDEYVDEELF